MFREKGFIRIGVELRGASSVLLLVGRLRVLEFSFRLFIRLTIAKQCIQEKNISISVAAVSMGGRVDNVGMWSIKYGWGVPILLF